MEYNEEIINKLNDRISRSEKIYVISDILDISGYNLKRLENYCWELNEKDKDYIIKLYHLYEFSDKLHVVSQKAPYATIFNLLKTGVLTEEEVVNALLHLKGNG